MIPADHALSPKAGYGTAVKIEWGLVSIPIRLHLVADDDRTVPKRSMFSKATGNQIGTSKHDKITLAPVTEDGIVKKVQITDTEWVELTDDEIEMHCAATFHKGLAPIVAFVPLADVAQNYVVEKPGVWKPENTKVGKVKIVDPTAHKAFSLLTAAMAKREVAALILLPTRSGGQYVALFPDGRCGWLCYAENVRQHQPTELLDVTDEEIKLANQLIDGIGVRTPVLRDEAGERIRAYLLKKAENPEAAAADVSEVVETPAVADLTALLAASIAANQPAAPAKPKRSKKAS